MSTAYDSRIARLRDHMAKAGWDAVFLSPGSDLQYVAGVERGMNQLTDLNMHGEEVYGVYISQTQVIFVIPELAILASEFGSELDGKPHITSQILIKDGISSPEIAEEVLRQLDAPKVLAVPARTWTRITLLMQEISPGLQVVDASRFISSMRAIKDPAEIEALKGAGRLTDLVFTEVVKRMKPGITELDILEEIEHQTYVNGGSGLSFHPAAAIRGKGVTRSTYGGGMANTRLAPGAVVSFDFGVIFHGYCSDFGRTVFVGEPDPLYARYHKVIMDVQSQCISSMKAGTITCAELDAMSRRLMATEKLDHLFPHRLGHGVGIDVHESPIIYSRNNQILEAGMTTAVELCCYIPGVIGVRCEDVVLTTREGGLPLSNYSRDLTVI